MLIMTNDHDNDSAADYIDDGDAYDDDDGDDDDYNDFDVCLSKH
jgi:hypothetical protein